MMNSMQTLKLKLKELEEIEKDVAGALQSAGLAVIELGKDKPSMKQVEANATTFLKTLQAVENSLLKHILYLTQVSTVQPHEGSSYAAQKVFHMALHRLEHARSRMNEMERQRQQHLQQDAQYNPPLPLQQLPIQPSGGVMPGGPQGQLGQSQIGPMGPNISMQGSLVSTMGQTGLSMNQVPMGGPMQGNQIGVGQSQGQIGPLGGGLVQQGQMGQMPIMAQQAQMSAMTAAQMGNLGAVGQQGPMVQGGPNLGEQYGGSIMGTGQPQLGMRPPGPGIMGQQNQMSVGNMGAPQLGLGPHMGGLSGQMNPQGP